MAYCKEYIDFRNRFCPGMDLDDPLVLLRLEEEIDKLKKELGENESDVPKKQAQYAPTNKTDSCQEGSGDEATSPIYKEIKKQNKKISLEEMVNAVNRYQADHGKVVIGIDDEDIHINFFMPKDVFNKIKHGIRSKTQTKQQYRSFKKVVDVIMDMDWAYTWGEGMARAVYGHTRWDLLSESEKEDIIRDLIRRTLARTLM